MLFQQYLDTSDDRFFQARETLIRDLPAMLFEPPIPAGNNLRAGKIAGKISGKISDLKEKIGVSSQFESLDGSNTIRR